MRFIPLLLPTFRQKMKPIFNLLSLLLFIVALPFISCRDLEADVPSYLTISKIEVNVTDVDQGTNSSSFSDAYVYINDRLIGIYNLPANIPITQSGQVKLSIGGGIKQNGVYESRLEYPFYTRFDTIVNLIVGETIEVNPILEYKNNVDFNVFAENFETGVNFLKGNTSDTNFVRTDEPDESFEGFSGKLILEEGKERFEVYTPDISDVPRFNTSPVYMELDFKGNIFVNVGSYFDNRRTNQIYVVLPPKETWTKVYINLTEMLATNGNASNFNFFFAYNKAVTNFKGTAEFYVDNVKIVTF